MTFDEGPLVSMTLVLQQISAKEAFRTNWNNLETVGSRTTMNASDKVFVVRNTEEEEREEETGKKDPTKITWMSCILRLVIKFHLVPVTWDEQNSRLHFRLWSNASFLACAVTVVTFASYLSVFILCGLFSAMFSSEINFIDKAVKSVLPIFIPTLDLYSIILAYGLAKVSSLALSADLPWPSEGPLLLVGLLLTVGVSCPAGTDL